MNMMTVNQVNVDHLGCLDVTSSNSTTPVRRHQLWRTWPSYKVDPDFGLDFLSAEFSRKIKKILK